EDRHSYAEGTADPERQLDHVRTLGAHAEGPGASGERRGGLVRGTGGPDGRAARPEEPRLRGAFRVVPSPSSARRRPDRDGPLPRSRHGRGCAGVSGARHVPDPAAREGPRRARAAPPGEGARGLPVRRTDSPQAAGKIPFRRLRGGEPPRREGPLPRRPRRQPPPPLLPTPRHARRRGLRRRRGFRRAGPLPAGRERALPLDRGGAPLAGAAAARGIPPARSELPHGGGRERDLRGPGRGRPGDRLAHPRQRRHAWRGLPGLLPPRRREGPGAAVRKIRGGAGFLLGARGAMRGAVVPGRARAGTCGAGGSGGRVGENGRGVI
ncbi:MAG: Glycosyl transferase, group 1, partial [uncultured Rubrobacteraceae bacterium]